MPTLILEKLTSGGKPSSFWGDNGLGACATARHFGTFRVPNGAPWHMPHLSIQKK